LIRTVDDKRGEFTRAIGVDAQLATSDHHPIALCHDEARPVETPRVKACAANHRGDLFLIIGCCRADRDVIASVLGHKQMMGDGRPVGIDGASELAGSY
jgi:hypothetical protein